MQSKPLHLILQENTGLDLGHGTVEWVYPDGTKTVQPLQSMLKSLKHNSSGSYEVDHCFYKGNVHGDSGSIGKLIFTKICFQIKSTYTNIVALNLCNGLNGFIQSGNEGYVITPVGKETDWNIESEHEIIRVSNIPRNDKNFNRRKRGNSLKLLLFALLQTVSFVT